MDFAEWTDAHGIEKARAQFGLSDHMVFVVHPGKYVEGVCGRWRGSCPLATGLTILQAKQQLREAVCHCFATEETIMV